MSALAMSEPIVDRPIRVGSLFSGIGGFDLGFERAGMETVFFVENEPFCQQVLRARWPGVPVFDDVTAVGAETLPACDLLCGGFPCQDISVAGRGEGIRGARSGLWSEFARLIRELEPRWVVVENVSALLGRGLSVVLAELSEIGYDAEWDCLPASAIGAPHQRDRVWIVAYAGGERVRLKSERDQREGRGERAAERGDAVALDDGAAGHVARRDSREPGDVADSARDGAGGPAPARPKRQRTRKGGQRGRAGSVPDASSERLEGSGSGASGEPQRAASLGGRPRDGGGKGADPDTDGVGCGEQRLEDGQPGLEGARRDQSDGLRAPRPAGVGDAEGDGRGAGGTRRGLAGDGGGSRAARAGRRRQPEPHLGRGTDGLPARMDGSIVGVAEWLDGSWERGIPRTVAGRQKHRVARLRALGNALVPQIAQWIGMRIVQWEREHAE